MDRWDPHDNVVLLESHHMGAFINVSFYCHFLFLKLVPTSFLNYGGIFLILCFFFLTKT